MRAGVWAAMLVAVAACGGGDDSTADSGDDGYVTPDIAPDADGDTPDGAEAESGADADADADADVSDVSDIPDASDVVEAADDAGSDDSATIVPLDGFGLVTGDCGVLDDTEWSSAEPFLFRGSVDFGTTAFDPALLSAGGQEILRDGTAGGSSVNSEALAYDLLYRCELSELLLTETEIVYTAADSSLTDFLTDTDARNVAVSVVRAFHYPPADPCLEADLATLISRKLADALDAAAHADPANPWVRSILYVLAYNSQCADAAVAAYGTLDAATRADTIVFVTVTDGDDAFMY